MVTFVGQATVASASANRSKNHGGKKAPEGDVTTREELEGRATSTVAEALAMADNDGFVRFPFSSRERRRFAKLSQAEGDGDAAIALGYVAVDVNHLRDLPGETPIRLGFEMNYSAKEAELLE